MLTADKVAKRKKPRIYKSLRGEPVFHSELRAMREQWGLSVRDVEKETGVTKSTIFRAEHGMEVELGHALRLARFFSKTIEEIWKEK